MKPAFSRTIRALACATSLFLVAFSTWLSSAATINGSATATINQLLATIGKLRTTTDPGERDKLVSSIDASLATQKLSQRALGAQWSKLDSHRSILAEEPIEPVQRPVERTAEVQKKSRDHLREPLSLPAVACSH